MTYNLRAAIEAEARRYADSYSQGSDGRNTFTIFADWVGALASAPVDQEEVKRIDTEIGRALDWMDHHEWEKARLRLAGARVAIAALRTPASGRDEATCDSCDGLNTSCPVGCKRDPKTGELMPATEPDVRLSGAEGLRVLATGDGAEDVVERLAKLIRCFDKFSDDRPMGLGLSLGDFRVILAALATAVVPGMVMVPREPTSEMWAAGANAVVGYKQRHHDKVVEEVWSAMLSAVPRAEGIAND